MILSSASRCCSSALSSTKAIASPWPSWIGPGHLNSAPIKAEALREAQLAMIRGKVQIVGGMLQTSKDSTIIPLPEAIDLAADPNRRSDPVDVKQKI